MAMRSLALSTAPSTLPSAGQILVFIASDGVRVPVKRAIATEASLVLRDLLDGQDLQSTAHGDGSGPCSGFSGDERSSPHVVNNRASDAATELENLFEVVDATTPVTSGGAWQPSDQHQQRGEGCAKTAVVKEATKATVLDLMDFFPVEPVANPPLGTAAEMTGSVEASPTSNPSPRFCADCVYPSDSTPTRQPVPPAQTVYSSSRPSPPSVPPLPEVEVPFPYFTGDILERVCRHMSYRFRMSSFGTEDGCYRVYAIKTRIIPRPMTLPLVEYLDMKDRAFIADWDEFITVQMVKAATLLNYEELLQLASAKLASYLIDRDLEEVRMLLGVKGDFKPAEDAELKKERAVDCLR